MASKRVFLTWLLLASIMSRSIGFPASEYFKTFHRHQLSFRGRFFEARPYNLIKLTSRSAFLYSLLIQSNLRTPFCCWALSFNKLKQNENLFRHILRLYSILLAQIAAEIIISDWSVFEVYFVKCLWKPSQDFISYFQWDLTIVTSCLPSWRNFLEKALVLVEIS